MNRRLGLETAIRLASDVRHRTRSNPQESRLGYFLVQLVVDAIDRKLESIGDAKLVIDLAQIVLDHLLGCTELMSNFLVAHAW
jgi:hypothetical protein